jgi:hypothetical protein
MSLIFLLHPNDNPQPKSPNGETILAAPLPLAVPLGVVNEKAARSLAESSRPSSALDRVLLLLPAAGRIGRTL